jgi:hypothetical protein
MEKEIIKSLILLIQALIRSETEYVQDHSHKTFYKWDIREFESIAEQLSRLLEKENNV